MSATVPDCRVTPLPGGQTRLTVGVVDDLTCWHFGDRCPGPVFFPLMGDEDGAPGPGTRATRRTTTTAASGAGTITRAKPLVVRHLLHAHKPYDAEKAARNHQDFAGRAGFLVEKSKRPHRAFEVRRA